MSEITRCLSGLGIYFSYQTRHTGRKPRLGFLIIQPGFASDPISVIPYDPERTLKVMIKIKVAGFQRLLIDIGGPTWA